MIKKEYREERDFLGKKEVPKDAYYGIQTMRAIENFTISGHKLHSSRIVAMGMVKKAAALANMETGMLNKEIGRHIVYAAQALIDGHYHNEFPVDPFQGGAGTSINMNVNEVITNIALERMGHKKGDYSVINPNDHVNMSQSTNDAVPTSVNIATQMMLNQLLVTMEELYKTFKEKAVEFDHIIKMGRTHLQDAVPIRLGQEFDAYANVIRRDIERISRTRWNLNAVNMGATAVGTGLNADERYIELVIKYLGEISGFHIYSANNLIDATQNMDIMLVSFLGLSLFVIAGLTRNLILACSPTSSTA